MSPAPHDAEWEHGDYVRIQASGSPVGWILDIHDDGTVTILLKNGDTRRGPIVGRGSRHGWSPAAYGFHEGRRDTIRVMRALKLLS